LGRLSKNRLLMSPHETRNINAFLLLRLTTICLLMIFSACSAPAQKEEEWVDLFNGKDINDWIVKIHHYPAGENFGNTFG
jgi:hypothetical protein